MKTCTKCKIKKELSEFRKKKSYKDGLSYECKSCVKDYEFIYRRTNNGVVCSIYGEQVKNSKKRKHTPPEYTLYELKEWIFNQDLFHKIFDEWVVSGHDTDLKPSIDRLDDNKGYSFDNIQLMTWKENNDKASLDMRKGKLIVTSKPQKPVIQLTSNGEFIARYVSICEAFRATGSFQSNISSCCKGKLKTSGGYIWKYA